MTSSSSTEATTSWLPIFLSQFIASNVLSDIAPDLMRQVPMPSLTDAMGKAGLVLGSPMSIHLYRQWILANYNTSPDVFIAWFNLGLALTEIGELDKAIVAYRSAIQANPSFHGAFVNIALLYEKMGKMGEALAAWAKAIPGMKENRAVLNHYGALLMNQKRYAEAATLYRKLVEEEPENLEFQAFVNLIWQRTCRWDKIKSEIVDVVQAGGIPSMVPFGAMALFDDPVIQCRIAQEWLERRHPPAPKWLCPPEGYRHKKIRVGYMSGEFLGHFAMSILTAELFERHDRNQFEIYGYCSSPKEDSSATRKRIIASFDQFHWIRETKDEEAARLIRSHEIDLLVDLSGLTGQGREGVLRWKPAPVQVTYLGYVGPIPLPELDYILCDNYVIPPETAPLYRPKPLPLEGIYQANDSKIVVAPPTTREANALPPNAFVYCCLTAPYKITEEIFSAWMQILNRVPGSVLWLTFDSEVAKANLQAAAGVRGVEPTRVIFAPKVVPAHYLSQLRLADLSLSAFPYGPGTLASDALRMGLPVLTIEGKSFVSRMAGDLLTAVGLSELIAPDMQGYIDMAVELAENPEKLARYRTVLQDGAWDRSLGNIADFVPRLEKAYLSIVKRK